MHQFTLLWSPVANRGFSFYDTYLMLHKDGELTDIFCYPFKHCPVSRVLYSSHCACLSKTITDKEEYSTLVIQVSSYIKPASHCELPMD